MTKLNFTMLGGTAVEPATAWGSSTAHCDMYPRGTACLQGDVFYIACFAQGEVHNAKSQPDWKRSICSSLACMLLTHHNEGSHSCTEIAKESFNQAFHLDVRVLTD